MAVRAEKIIRVTLSDGRELHFTTVKAIFSHLTDDDIGVGYHTVSRFKIKDGEVFQNDKCKIEGFDVFTS